MKNIKELNQIYLETSNNIKKMFLSNKISASTANYYQMCIQIHYKNEIERLGLKFTNFPKKEK